MAVPRPKPPKPPKPARPRPVPPARPAQYRLLEDAKSYFNAGYIYAKKGEVVTMIRWNDDVSIVEGKERFPIRTEKLRQIIPADAPTREDGEE